MQEIIDNKELFMAMSMAMCCDDAGGRVTIVRSLELLADNNYQVPNHKDD